jgi:hypothetical protein
LSAARLNIHTLFVPPKYGGMEVNMKDLRAAGVKDGGEGRGTESAGQGIDPAKIINDYADKSESELMSDLLGAVNRGRENGTLNDAELDSFVARTSGFLSPEQTERMRGIVAGLKARK